MQSPPPDSSQYADLLEQLGSAIRLPEAVREDDDPARFSWATRAMAMTQTFVAMTVAAARPPH